MLALSLEHGHRSLVSLKVISEWYILLYDADHHLTFFARHILRFLTFIIKFCSFKIDSYHEQSAIYGAWHFAHSLSRPQQCNNTDEIATLQFWIIMYTPKLRLGWPCFSRGVHIQYHPAKNVIFILSCRMYFNHIYSKYNVLSCFYSFSELIYNLFCVRNTKKADTYSTNLMIK